MPLVTAGCCLTFWSAVAVSQQSVDFQDVVRLPDIVRFRQLPKRMFLEPNISIPAETLFVTDARLKLYERILVSPPDNEILIKVIRSLERIQSEGLADISHAAESLHKHLLNTDHELVKQASASALATIGRAESAADVAQLCVPEREVLCLKIEPTFSSWGGDALKSTWVNRVENSEKFPRALIRLACDGLAQLKDISALEAVRRLLENEMTDYSVRYAAAQALGTLDHLQSAALAGNYSPGTVPDRLLACALLGHCRSDAGFDALSTLCDDTSNAVASQAWATMLRLDRQRLLEKLDRGVQHPDSNIRLNSVEVMRELPSSARCNNLDRLTADVHIGVRNSARRALKILADSRPEFRDTILRNAGDSLVDTNSNWQQLEQSLVLLGQLRHRTRQNEWLRLLEHDRPEIFVTAAWLLHMMPYQEMADEVVKVTLRRYEMTDRPGLNEQLIFLFQHAGFTNSKSLQPLFEKQFAKNSPRFEVRAAGLWALGKLNAGNADKVLAGKLVKRIRDLGLIPEGTIVRRMSVLALVWMDARSAVPEMFWIRRVDGPHSLIGETARWALPHLGGEQLPPPESLRVPVDDFPVSPF
ncbi:MAG: hypothetical protein MK110_07240 [Fuerstiella sp.]|nr:hypothetical protein [Fuerstiella sp.]